MSARDIEEKCRELRQLQALIDEAQAEAEAIKDALKPLWAGEKSCAQGSIGLHTE